MNEFTNNEVEYSSLPKFEQVQLKPLHPNYFKVILINIGIVFGMLGLALLGLYFLNDSLFPNKIWLLAFSAYFVCLVLLTFYFRLSFNLRGFAFREHDTIYKSGVIAQTTTIVPFKRVQHVALHQGLFSRYFGLASLELFTAGGSSTDLEIKGLKLEEAQQFKNWIVQKIDNLVEEEIEEDFLDKPTNLDTSENA